MVLGVYSRDRPVRLRAVANISNCLQTHRAVLIVRLAGRQPHDRGVTSIDSAHGSTAAFQHSFHKGLEIINKALRWEPTASSENCPALIAVTLHPMVAKPSARS